MVIPAEHRGLFRTLYAGDAARTFLRAIDLPAAANQIYHVAMQELVSVERWTDLIWAAAGHTAEITFVPDAVIRRQSGLDAYAPPLTRAVSTVWDLSKAERDLGFRTTAPRPAGFRTPSTGTATTHQQDDPRTAYAHRAAGSSSAAGGAPPTMAWSTGSGLGPNPWRSAMPIGLIFRLHHERRVPAAARAPRVAYARSRPGPAAS